MNIELFMYLLTLGSVVSSLLTEALKKSIKNIPTNIIALVNACIVGGLGTIAAYILMGIDFTLANCVCIALMTVCIWIGSMIGYDKLMQTLSQLKG